MQRILVAGVAVALFCLVGCEKPPKREIMKKSEKVQKSADLEKVLGSPDKATELDIGIRKNETWTYEAKDGKVVFKIQDGQVMSRQALDAGEER